MISLKMLAQKMIKLQKNNSNGKAPVDFDMPLVKICRCFCCCARHASKSPVVFIWLEYFKYRQKEVKI